VFLVRLIALFLRPGRRDRTAAPWPSSASHALLSSRQDYEAPLGVSERSGQLRPYVRPVARHWPLAIMGVRVRVRHQSVWRARGTRLL